MYLEQKNKIIPFCEKMIWEIVFIATCFIIGNVFVFTMANSSVYLIIYVTFTVILVGVVIISKVFVRMKLEQEQDRLLFELRRYQTKIIEIQFDAENQRHTDESIALIQKDLKIMYEGLLKLDREQLFRDDLQRVNIEMEGLFKTMGQFSIELQNIPK